MNLSCRLCSCRIPCSTPQEKDLSVGQISVRVGFRRWCLSMRSSFLWRQPYGQGQWFRMPNQQNPWLKKFPSVLLWSPKRTPHEDPHHHSHGIFPTYKTPCKNSTSCHSQCLFSKAANGRSKSQLRPTTTMSKASPYHVMKPVWRRGAAAPPSHTLDP